MRLWPCHYSQFVPPNNQTVRKILIFSLFIGIYILLSMSVYQWPCWFPHFHDVETCITLLVSSNHALGKYMCIWRTLYLEVVKSCNAYHVYIPMFALQQSIARIICSQIFCHRTWVYNNAWSVSFLEEFVCEDRTWLQNMHDMVVSCEESIAR